MYCTITYTCILDKTNKASIQNIKRSIFVLCLDELLPGDMSDERSVAAKMMLHGGGSQLNTGNRWFDKTIQVSGRQHLVWPDYTCISCPMVLNNYK